MRLRGDHCIVQVPATISSFGPNESALTLALGLYDQISIRASTIPTRVTVEGFDTVSDSAGSALFVTVLQTALEQVGAPLFGVAAHCRNGIPRDRGLGEEAAAVVGGLLAARSLVGIPEAFSAETFVDLAVRFGVDAQNAIAAFHGGAILSAGATNQVSTRLPIRPEIFPTVFVPGFAVDEDLAAATFPVTIPFDLAQVDSANTALLASVLSETTMERPQNWFDLLRESTIGRGLEGYRRTLSPSSAALAQWLTDKGQPAMVIGHGPCVLTLLPVSQQLQQAAQESGWSSYPCGMAAVGAQVETGPLTGSLSWL